ncbi:large conductance mechanosensitive channel protein MscL [Bartonella schoenbuchensis]|uniref:Large-conductance mechanosensitive channel n=1 Tax=Bartonella schoenbuchensis (strain DSM 13525 / NCTC 13165 / R1) TaxID=687861 RepID=E6YZ28_BARSR|nr:large conductance mechanosensitive channel protein MscL [Bartonella schoenbuchensis]AQX30220.1 large conductance mechanosensitive channel [Bartonella schoenbuchensis R1]CBI81768.1 Large-conductance mechanosensitive channel [Bartonella schoenbuchensis R1]
MLKEFKEFALKGNMIDLAIGVIIGSAFSGLINSIVNDIFMPIIGFITGGIDFSNMFIQLAGEKQATLSAAKEAGATIAYGNFMTLFINFLIIAWILFLFVKGLNKMRRQKEEVEKLKEMSLEEQLLTEIKDLLTPKN